MSNYMKDIRKAAIDTISEINNTVSTPEDINSALGAKTFITPQRKETTIIDTLQLKNSSISIGSDGALEIR